MRITIGKKLIGGFGLVLVVMTAIIVAVIIGVWKLHGNFRFTEQRSVPAITGTLEIRGCFRQEALANSLILQGQIKEAEVIMSDADKEYDDALSKWKESQLVSGIEISKIGVLHGQVHDALKKIINAYQASPDQISDTAKSEAINELDDALVSAEGVLTQLKTKIDAKAAEAFRAANRTMGLIRMTSVGLGFIGVMLGLAIGSIVSRAISRPIRSGIARITSAASQILAASEEQATGIEEEAAQISEVATSSRQLSATAKQVTDNTQEIAKYTSATMQTASSGSKAVNDVIEGMDKIRQSILDTAKRIESLGERGQDIAEIITLIEDVADQTNILSLNAAIEAARAGEAGRGFAVVADAIGRLAERTTKSSKDISNLVKIIQQDTSSCVMSMEESTKETEAGETLAKEAGKRLKDIESSFKHVADAVKEIALASQQQASGSEQISKAIVGIDQVMRQSATSAKQSKELARNLVELADNFREIIGKVKIQNV